jgi:L-asparaginase
MDAISVSARRGGTVEAVHRVHAVAVGERGIVAAAGDARLVACLRSSAKPLQALALARARPDLDDPLIAIACASHHADPDQLAAVDALLAAAPATEAELQCGSQEGRPASARFHNCSGKHAGMLAACRARDWPAAGYVRAEHPLQREVLEIVSEAAELPAPEVRLEPDGCGVPTFVLPLARMARAFARLAALEDGARVADAMAAHPRLIGGAQSVDVLLMLARPGWIAKGGAEGLLCARTSGGTGLALKAEDGSQRPLGPALAAFLRLLGEDLEELAAAPVTDSRGDVVGEVAADPW